MPTPYESARAAFRARYGAEPSVLVSAPGRVNLIGEHTDYNAGFVLPMPLPQRTHLAARPLDETILRVHAVQLGEEAEIDLRAAAPLPPQPWARYLAGVAHVLAAQGHVLAGAEAVLTGDVPLGCGLSSSAALEMATVRLFETLGGFRLDDERAARIGQQAEHTYLGVHCGIMDQFASRAGRPGHALFLDCRSLALEQVPVNLPEHCFVVANTHAPRSLAASQYNERVAECARAMAVLAPVAAPPASHLRDVDLPGLESMRPALDEIAYRRARHVITENARTREACAALRQGDAARLGGLMNASDASLREDYAVTGPDLDAMTACARSAPGCLGSRMTGAGFGGCAIHLVERQALSAFLNRLSVEYAATTGRVPTLWVLAGMPIV